MTRHSDPPRLTPAEWLLAETVRRADEAADDFELDDPATVAARQVPGTAAARIVERARRKSHGERTGDNGHDLVAEIGQALSTMRWLFGALLAAGLLAGIAAAASLPASADTIALSYALIALLGIPSLFLFLWLGLSLRPRRASVAGGLPGRIGWWALTAWTRRFGLATQRRHLAAALAEFGRLRGGGLLALATHAFWAMFYLGCIGWLWLRFLGLRFDFSWETTLLAGDWLQSIIAAIGWLPASLFGLALPSAEQIQALIADRSAGTDRGLWAGYLLSVLATYGLAPRALLTMFFAWGQRRMRLGLDLGRPGYLRLLPALAAQYSEATGRVGPAPPPAQRQAQQHSPGPRASAPGDGDPVLIGVELDRDRERWPPDIPGCRVLGRADNRRQQRDLGQALRLLDPPPERIVALCSLTRTPDRGTGQWLSELTDVAPVEIRLEGAGALAGLNVDAGARRDDWARLADRYGLELAPGDVDPCR